MKQFFKNPIILIVLILVACAVLVTVILLQKRNIYTHSGKLVTNINKVSDANHIQAVVSFHHLATEAGFEVLNNGGTATVPF